MAKTAKQIKDEHINDIRGSVGALAGLNAHEWRLVLASNPEAQHDLTLARNFLRAIVEGANLALRDDMSI